MSVPLGKSPKTPEERRELITEHLRAEEYLAHLQATHIQRKVVEYLLFERGYAPEEVEVNCEFTVELPGCVFPVRADIVARVAGRNVFVVKCVMSSLESWERHSLAFCRVADSCQIPYAIVTDGETALRVDAATGFTTHGGLELVPTRQEAGAFITGEPCPHPEERAEREKRVLYAFDAIRCTADPPSGE